MSDEEYNLINAEIFAESVYIEIDGIFRTVNVGDVLYLNNEVFDLPIGTPMEVLGCISVNHLNYLGLKKIGDNLNHVKYKIHRSNLTYSLDYIKYLLDLIDRCKANNFAPFDDRVPVDNNGFRWDFHTIKIAENWLSKFKYQNLFTDLISDLKSMDIVNINELDNIIKKYENKL